MGIDYVVTGHYACIEYDNLSGRYLLKKATDKNKDQSYVLYAMTQEQLKHTLFPHRHSEQWAAVTQTDSDTLEIEFDEPQRAVTKGQAVVLYDGDIVIGGGTIQ